MSRFKPIIPLRLERRAILIASALCVNVAFAASAAPDFIREVQPIFKRSCYGCHGPARQRSGYRLDRREIAIRGGDSGKAAITPHDAAKSPLIHYVSGQAEIRMPPEGSSVPPLSREEIAILTAWIDAGPAWPEESGQDSTPEKPHWSLAPLVQPPVPPSATETHANPIDAFIRARLVEKNLAPSPEADRRTLIRRLSYDLVGLPPSPEEVEAFQSDPDPAAYDKLADRLLASPRHGERWARHWLDTIHFADSHGYEHDIPRENAWRFRDYVISAFNADTPWSRFIREQLAADYFYPDEPKLTAALGFLGAGTFDLSTFSTGPVTFDYLDRDDLVTQTMSAFASTTANCARCHAHKFDPIPQEDYYALQAVFAGVLKGEVAYDEDAGVARDRRRWTRLLTAADARVTTELLAPENLPLVRDWWERRGAGPAWMPLDLETFLSAEGATQTRAPGGAILVGGKRADKDVYTITAKSTLTEITALRLDVLAEDSLPQKGPGRQDNGNFHLTEFELRVFEPDAPEPRRVKVRRATADFNQADWNIAAAIDGKEKTAWGIHPAEGQSHYAVFELAEKLRLKPAATLAITLDQAHGEGHLIGAYRLSATSGDPEHAAALTPLAEEALRRPPPERTLDQQTEVAAHAMRFIAEDALAKLPEQSRVYAAAASVDIMTGDPPRQAQSLKAPKVVHVLQRGEFDKPGAIAQPGALSALKHLPSRFDCPADGTEAARRAALADWLAHPGNVLVWRSVVNRVWHDHFGRGLCDTPSDLGKMGGTPSHPELLDWLAVWFRDEAKGSPKALHRLIVTSAVYRQSSAHREEAERIDEENRLLWRQNPQRLDADAIRDYALAISGRLDPAMGGPGIRHFKESKGPQLTASLDYTGYDWSKPGVGRRSIYSFVWRGIADPFMEALDFPDLGLLSPVRGFSASSLQALALFNDDFVLFQSRALAERLEKETPDLDAEVARAVELVWQRRPTPEEQTEFCAFARERGLAALCRVLFNSNEFLFVS